MYKINKMNASKLFKKAHELTKKIKAEFIKTDYKSQFGICLKFLYHIKSLSQHVGHIGEVIHDKMLKLYKVQEFSNGAFGYILKDAEDNIYKWTTFFKIVKNKAGTVFFNQFAIKNHVTISNVDQNIIGHCRVELMND